MNAESIDNISNRQEIINLYFGISKDWWEVAYYIGQGIAVVSLFIGIILTVSNLRLSRRALNHIEHTNEKNNLIQERYVLQSRLTELSHEWNSKPFVEARNRAALIFEVEFLGKFEQIRTSLFTKERIEDWICISTVAHFFVRLSYIQETNQIYFEHACAEFSEAIGYWRKFLIAAYGNDPEEERLRVQLIKLDRLYNGSSTNGIEPDRSSEMSI
ncbi:MULTISPECIES: hypothetical protein [Rhizobium/Agrobacterium group]|uniref:hypothetical protein n=1 Tax=Rhizobium/Agrobacterium group TaxID=227290 RepID=UPI0023009985|nr:MULTISPECIES: hypothetical protein [Rhizobium/Agrobacterium group]MDA5633145.1 hypothetical protein [Agrobacterium sp. ST15.16.024]MDF1890927.1 hypothetical protein [Rhizobium rhizogenes]